MSFWQNLLLAIIEGLSEYLPISSTGHLLMATKLMGLDLANLKTYIVAIQFGAILSVIVIYWKRFFNFKKLDFYLKLLAGFIPAAILGFLFDDMLEKLLESPWVVGITLVIIGIFLLIMEKVLPEGAKTVDEISYIDAAIIGTVQCFAMIPGVSRSAASIAGALGRKLSKTAATEFSFFLAVPTLTAAGGYSLLKHYKELTSSDLSNIAVGNVISFIVGIIAIKFFIGLVQKTGFKWFGIYRIAVGLAFMAFLCL